MEVWASWQLHGLFPSTCKGTFPGILHSFSDNSWSRILPVLFVCLQCPVRDSLVAELCLFLSNFHWFSFLFCFSVSQSTTSLPTYFLIPLVEKEIFHCKGIRRKSQQFSVAVFFFLLSTNKLQDRCWDGRSPSVWRSNTVASLKLVERC